MPQLSSGSERDGEDDWFFEPDDEPVNAPFVAPDDEMPDPPEPEPELDRHEIVKRAAAQWARDLLASERFVIFDTETTGFDPDDEIIQIGVIDHDGNTILDQLIKPTQPILNRQYHGITDDTVKDAPGFPEVYQLIEGALDGKKVLAYNYAYDSRMLGQVCIQHDLPTIVGPPVNNDHCAMEQYAAYYGQWNPSKNSYTWKKLRDALFEFGLKHEDFGEKEHDACTDARATLALIKKMAEYNPA